MWSFPWIDSILHLMPTSDVISLLTTSSATDGCAGQNYAQIHNFMWMQKAHKFCTQDTSYYCNWSKMVTVTTCTIKPMRLCIVECTHSVNCLRVLKRCLNDLAWERSTDLSCLFLLENLIQNVLLWYAYTLSSYPSVYNTCVLCMCLIPHLSVVTHTPFPMYSFVFLVLLRVGGVQCRYMDKQPTATTFFNVSNIVVH